MFTEFLNLFEEAGLLMEEVGYKATHPEVWDSASSSSDGNKSDKEETSLERRFRTMKEAHLVNENDSRVDDTDRDPLEESHSTKNDMDIMMKSMMSEEDIHILKQLSELEDPNVSDEKKVELIKSLSDKKLTIDIGKLIKAHK